MRQQSSIPAPEFPPGLQWLNTDHPLSLRQLRGKVVLLDFWTYCCINCVHVLPDLKRLEHKYPDELVVIGVHSAKFSAEQDTDNIRSAILRYEIEHPVVNDRDMRIWDSYAVQAWPTVVLIDPEGRIVARHSGEGVYDVFAPIVARIIDEATRGGTLRRGRLQFRLERDGVAPSPLAFPGKVLADEKSGRLFIADSGHNRIIVSTLEGEVLDVIGSGRIGFDDGSFDEATFHHPQGMALDGTALYIADTDNHAIRRADLLRRTVITIAGNGRQARLRDRTGIGTAVELNSPWDLALEGHLLMIAMAGAHQIWRMNLRSYELEPYAGSGVEGLVDGPLRAAALAQPSGLTSDGVRLFFADSEASAIRYADLPPGGQVGTIVGAGLFEFGDRDGHAYEARLQHPLGVVHHGGELFIADTYNNKIKRINPRSGRTETLLGTGEAGLVDGEPAQFDEPGGISYAAGRLYIADTNNHAIRVTSIEGGDVRTLQLHPLKRLYSFPATEATAEALQLPAHLLGAGDGEIVLDLQLPQGCKLNPRAPSSLQVSAEGDALTLKGGTTDARLSIDNTTVRVPLRARPGTDRLELMLTLYYCTTGTDAACFFDEARLVVPVQVRGGIDTHTLHIPYAVQRTSPAR